MRTIKSLLQPGKPETSGRVYSAYSYIFTIPSSVKSLIPSVRHSETSFTSHFGGKATSKAAAQRRSFDTATEKRDFGRYDYDYAPPPGYSRSPPGPPNIPPGGPPEGPEDKNSNLKNYLIAAAFFIGMGTGVWFDSGASFTPGSVASTEIVDRKTPNSEICMSSGSSSMVFDQRIFVSFNPFNVYVAQPEVKPGCVLRQSNVNVLEKRKLVTDKEVSSCTRSSNTFAFVGDLDQSPEVSCVYHSEDAENAFLKNPKRAVLGDGFRPAELSSNSGSSQSGKIQ